MAGHHKVFGVACSLRRHGVDGGRHGVGGTHVGGTHVGVLSLGDCQQAAEGCDVNEGHGYDIFS